MTNKLYSILIGLPNCAWDMLFHPDAGENYSPIDFIERQGPREQANIKNKLALIRRIENPTEWPLTVKLIRHADERIYQYTIGDFRFYFGIEGRTIHVVYACRKVSQKAKMQDLDRAIHTLRAYVPKKDGQK